MSDGSETFVVLLTPPGRGAIATVLVTGAAAAEMVDRLFHPAGAAALSARALGQIVFGRWQSAEQGEEVVACRRAAEQIEIHCHGGDTASAAIINDLCRAGATAVRWQDWTRHATTDPLVAAAAIALASALTPRAALVLVDQHAGALSRACDALAAQLRAGERAAALAALNALLAWAPLGLHLTAPWRVVLAGEPNVGKSSLVNALLGYARSIVHATAGTTRDVLTAATAFDGWPVELSDTAGLRDTGAPLEAAGIQLAEARIAAADLVLLVADASGADPAASNVLSARYGGALRVWNKCDLLPQAARDIPQAERLLVSATAGLGLEALERKIVARLAPAVPARGQAVPFTASQVLALGEIRQLLARGELAEAATALDRRADWAE